MVVASAAAVPENCVVHIAAVAALPPPPPSSGCCCCCCRSRQIGSCRMDGWQSAAGRSSSSPDYMHLMLQNRLLSSENDSSGGGDGKSPLVKEATANGTETKANCVGRCCRRHHICFAFGQQQRRRRQHDGRQNNNQMPNRQQTFGLERRTSKACKVRMLMNCWLG